MLATFRDERRLFAVAVGCRPFRNRLRFDRDTGVLEIQRPLRKTRSIPAAEID
jgi:hypothetical protein